MIVHTDFSRFHHSTPLVVTIGTFDGVHLGHRAIIDRLKKVAQQIGGETVLLTFYPHPRMVLHPDNHDLKLLNSPQEKAKLLQQAGIEHLLIYPFSEDFSRLPAMDYIRNLLVTGIGAHTIIIGYDHRFGRNREGDFRTLKELSEVFGYQIEEIPARDIDEVHISSTKIRQALLSGEVDYASKLLGYRYSLSGTVVYGQGKGKGIGFATANIRVDYPYKLIPGNGVYVVWTTLNGTDYLGVLNIGVRPTVADSSEVHVEVHIPGFNQTIYGENLSVAFVAKLRNEQKFGSVQELREQILIDIHKAKSYL